ncbi:MAG: DJ-1/PfpI family protein [Verrucomicrobiae bacterium]|nr:DJ-1/PfpI family protein [Verrucomicrobiae bacterium]
MIRPTTLALLADGFEEIEAITVVDVLRRAGVAVTVAGLRDGPIEAARQTRHLAETTLETVGERLFDAIVLPGGQPGTNHLKSDSRVREAVLRHARAGKWVAAICAAPLVLQDLGLLSGRRITSHPSVASEFPGAHYAEDRVVVDGRIVTSRAAGTAFEFSLKLAELLAGVSAAREITAATLAIV